MSNLDELEKKFEDAVKKSTSLKNVDNNDLLFLYSHYKQSTIGDCNMTEPSFWDLKGKAKYNAWKSIEGMSDKEAKEKYIKMVKKLGE